MTTAAFDAAFRPRGRVEQRVRVPASDAGSFHDVHARLPLRPGRYEIRLAAEHDGRAGSLLANIDVPDYSTKGLHGSTLVIGHPGASPNSALAELLPVMPTAVRDFATTARVVAFLRFYQSGAAAVPVDVTARLLDEHGHPVVTRTDSLRPGRFAKHGAADFEVPLALAALTPGAYLLVIDAVSPAGTLRRQTHIVVR